MYINFRVINNNIMQLLNKFILLKSFVKISMVILTKSTGCMRVIKTRILMNNDGLRIEQKLLFNLRKYN